MRWKRRNLEWSFFMIEVLCGVLKRQTSSVFCLLDFSDASFLDITEMRQKYIEFWEDLCKNQWHPTLERVCCLHGEDKGVTVHM